MAESNKKKLEANQFESINVNYGLAYEKSDSIKAEEINHIINGVLFNTKQLDKMKNEEQLATTVLAGPEGINPEAPAYRTLTPDDLPDLQSFLGILGVKNGGTGRGAGSNPISANSLLAGLNSDNNITRMLSIVLDSSDGIITSSVMLNNDIGENKNFLWRYHYDEEKKIYVIKIPIFDNGSAKYFKIQYGQKYIEKAEGNTVVNLSEAYSDNGFFAMVSSGRDKTDEWGVDTAYVKNSGNQSITIVKDHYYSAHPLTVHWITIGK